MIKLTAKGRVSAHGEHFNYFHHQITSQNPYAEVFIGEPFVQTVNIRNMAEVEEALAKIFNSSVSCKLRLGDN